MLESIVADLVDAIIEHVVHFPSDEGDPLSLSAVLVDASNTSSRDDQEDDDDVISARRDLLHEMARIAVASDFVPVPRCSRAKKSAFHEALCEYHAMFRTDDGVDLTTDEEMFAAFKTSVENIDRQDAADWLNDRKETFQDAFERIRRDARVKITETIVKVYAPPAVATRDDTTVFREKSLLEHYLCDNANA